MAVTPNTDLLVSYREFMGDPKRIRAIQKVAPKHVQPETFANIAIQAGVKMPSLLECPFMSIYTCIIQACELGLPPNTHQGLSYLIPYERSYQEPNGQWKKA